MDPAPYGDLHMMIITNEPIGGGKKVPVAFDYPSAVDGLFMEDSGDDFVLVARLNSGRRVVLKNTNSVNRTVQEMKNIADNYNKGLAYMNYISGPDIE